MIIEVTCRIADGAPRPGALEVTQVVAPLVNWSVTTHDGSEEWGRQGDDVTVELRLPDNTVWTGDAYAKANDEPGNSEVYLRGTGPLKENSVPIHADVVLKRLDAMPTVGS